MIRRLFVANRGEIALRIIRTARRLGMTTILGSSEADRESLPALAADEVAIVGPAASAESYLSIDRMVAAARQAKADAIHPGYGFLSENAAFARAVAEAGIVFVGPDPATLEAMGDKLNARRIAAEAGLPVVPGGEAADAEAARVRAGETGYPLTRDTYTVGRHRNNDIVVSDPKVSSFHARFDRTLEGFVLVDLRSRNGSFVNGKRVDAVVLQNGDEVRLGTARLRYKMD